MTEITPSSSGPDDGHGAPQEQPPVYGAGAPTPGPTPGPAATRPAELLERFLAKLIDGVLMFAVNMVLVTVIIFGAIFSSDVSNLLIGVVGSILQVVIYLGYLSFMESTRGQTVGKMVLKLRVLGPDGNNPTLEQAIRRNIWAGLGILGVVPVVGAVIGGLAQLAATIMIAVGINNDTVNRQAWHDQFAGGTRVIKEG